MSMSEKANKTEKERKILYQMLQDAEQTEGVDEGVDEAEIVEPTQSHAAGAADSAAGSSISDLMTAGKKGMVLFSEKSLQELPAGWMMLIQSKMFLLETQYSRFSGTLVCMGVSPYFDALSQGEEIPTYYIELNVKDQQLTVTRITIPEKE
jgi:hypothetical protein